MSINEKRAWFGLAVCALAALAILGIYRFTGSAIRSSAGFGVLGLLGLQPAIGLVRKHRGEVIEDERDRFITVRAATIAFGVLWVISIAACLTVYGTRGEQGAVPVSGLMLALWMAYLLFAVIHSVAVIWMYRKGRAEI